MFLAHGKGSVRRGSFLLFTFFVFFTYAECWKRGYIQSRVHFANGGSRGTKIGVLILRSSTCKCKRSEELTQRTDDVDRKFEDGKDSAVGNTLNDIFFGGGGKNKSSGTTATPNTTSTSTTNIPTTQSQRDCNKCCYCFDVGCPCECGPQCKELTSTATTAALPKPQQCKCVTFGMSCFICPCISSCNPVPPNKCPCAVDSSRPYACPEQFTRRIFDASSDDTAQLTQLYQQGYRPFNQLNITSPCTGDGTLNILPNSYAGYQLSPAVPAWIPGGVYQVPPGTQSSDHYVHPPPYPRQYPSGPSPPAPPPSKQQYIVPQPGPSPYVAPPVQPQPCIPQPSGYPTAPNSPYQPGYLTGPTLSTSPTTPESPNASPQTVISSILICFVFVVGTTGLFTL